MFLLSVILVFSLFAGVLKRKSRDKRGMIDQWNGKDRGEKQKRRITHCKARGGLKLTSTRYVVSVCSLTVLSCLKRCVVSILQNTGRPSGSFLIDSVTRNVPWLCMGRQLLRTFCSPANAHHKVECGWQAVRKILAAGPRDFVWKYTLFRKCSLNAVQ